MTEEKPKARRKSGSFRSQRLADELFREPIEEIDPTSGRSPSSGTPYTAPASGVPLGAPSNDAPSGRAIDGAPAGKALDGVPSDAAPRTVPSNGLNVDAGTARPSNADPSSLTPSAGPAGAAAAGGDPSRFIVPVKPRSRGWLLIAILAIVGVGGGLWALRPLFALRARGAAPVEPAPPAPIAAEPPGGTAGVPSTTAAGEPSALLAPPSAEPEASARGPGKASPTSARNPAASAHNPDGKKTSGPAVKPTSKPSTSSSPVIF